MRKSLRESQVKRNSDLQVNIISLTMYDILIEIKVKSKKDIRFVLFVLILTFNSSRLTVFLLCASFPVSSVQINR